MKFLPYAFFIVLLNSLFVSGSLFAQSRPNVVLIVADDLGWKDVGFMGSQYYRTPNLDMLADEGMVFGHAYAGAANCAPSRAILMSGRYPMEHGIYTVNTAFRGKSADRAIIPVETATVLPDSIVTLAETLQTAGYRTGIFGKWHLGEDPASQGFDHVSAGTPRRKSHFAPFNLPRFPEGKEGEYLTDRIAEEAVQFIKQEKDNPFFLYLPFFSIHTKLVGKPETVAKYKAIQPKDGQGNNADYAAMVEHVDAAVGRVMASISEHGLDENTLVIFTSDNGGIAYLSRQWPLRAGKGSYYEGGIRVPMLFRWPGKVPQGKSNVPVSFIDLYPTLLGLSGTKSAQPLSLEGTDLSSVVKGEKPTTAQSDRALFWHFPIYLEAYNGIGDDSRDSLFRTRPGTVMRQGKWKLHEYFEFEELELYDLSQDPGERINLASLLPEKTAELHAAMQAWRKMNNAPVPTERNPEYQK
jgi:arylsulfatase A-like enzyme